LTEVVALDRNHHYAVVGSIMRLDHAYDPRQLWLAFVVALIRQPDTTVKVPLARSALAMQRLQERIYARPPRENAAEVGYRYQRGVAQRRLAFIEDRMVGDGEWKALADAGFPAWDLLDDLPAGLPVGDHASGEVRAWLLDHCRGRFRISRANRRFIRFERVSDYAMAKLRFS
jgi:hypothetical protein